MSQFGLIFTKQKLVSVTEFDLISSAHVNVTHQVQLPIRKLLCRTKEVKRTNSVGEGLPASRKRCILADGHHQCVWSKQL